MLLILELFSYAKNPPQMYLLFKFVRSELCELNMFQLTNISKKVWNSVHVLKLFPGLESTINKLHLYKRWNNNVEKSSNSNIQDTSRSSVYSLVDLHFVRFSFFKLCFFLENPKFQQKKFRSYVGSHHDSISRLSFIDAKLFVFFFWTSLSSYHPLQPFLYPHV